MTVKQSAWHWRSAGSGKSQRSAASACRPELLRAGKGRKRTGLGGPPAVPRAETATCLPDSRFGPSNGRKTSSGQRSRMDAQRLHPLAGDAATWNRSLIARPGKRRRGFPRSTEGRGEVAWQTQAVAGRRQRGDGRRAWLVAFTSTWRWRWEQPCPVGRHIAVDESWDGTVGNGNTETVWPCKLRPLERWPAAVLVKHAFWTDAPGPQCIVAVSWPREYPGTNRTPST